MDNIFFKTESAYGTYYTVIYIIISKFTHAQTDGQIENVMPLATHGMGDGEA